MEEEGQESQHPISINPLTPVYTETPTRPALENKYFSLLLGEGVQPLKKGEVTWRSYTALEILIVIPAQGTTCRWQPALSYASLVGSGWGRSYCHQVWRPEGFGRDESGWVSAFVLWIQGSGFSRLTQLTLVPPLPFLFLFLFFLLAPLIIVGSRLKNLITVIFVGVWEGTKVDLCIHPRELLNSHHF